MGGYTLAVDYGTSNTVALLRWPDGRVRPLLFDGSPLLSSAVYAEDGGHLLVGRDAIHGARREPARFEPNPKRCIDYFDVLLGGRTLAVTDLVAAAFHRVSEEARQVTGGAPTSVVLTHPAEWGGARRSVLVDAAAVVGWVAPSLVPEPVAAATYFAAVLGHRIPVGSCVVVYDLGAGTFDVSVVRRDAEGHQTLACRGLDDLGGVDFDQKIIDLLGDALVATAPAEWKQLTAPQTLAERRHARMLRDDARTAKEQLSRSASATVLVPILDRDAVVTRVEFDALARPLIARTVEVTIATIRAARIEPTRIAGVFLVGGSTRIPLVATELHRALRIAPTVLEQPEIVVAEGALCIEDLRVPSPADPPASAPVAPPSGPAQQPGVAPPIAAAPTSAIDPPGLAWSAGESPNAPNRGAEVRFESSRRTLRIRGGALAALGPLSGLTLGWVAGGVTSQLTGDVEAGFVPAVPIWAAGALLGLLGLWRVVSPGQTRALTFNAVGVTRAQGNTVVSVPWSQIHQVRVRATPIIRTRRLVAEPATAVSVSSTEPWRSLYRSRVGGIRLGSLSTLQTREADVTTAIRRFAPQAGAAPVPPRRPV